MVKYQPGVTFYDEPAVVPEELGQLRDDLESCFALSRTSKNRTTHRQIARIKMREAIMWLGFELEAFHRGEWYSDS